MLKQIFLFLTEVAPPKQKAAMVDYEKLIWDPLYPEVWGAWEVERHQGGKASLSVKQKTNRQQEAGKLRYSVSVWMKVNSDSHKTGFALLSKHVAIRHQEYDSSVLFNPGDLPPFCIDLVCMNSCFGFFGFFTLSYDVVWFPKKLAKDGNPNSVVGHTSQELH